ncbi:hypothetical protein SDJN02_04469, partial [Cucurbita argyrosperma subsp. argyrosperma]
MAEKQKRKSIPVLPWMRSPVDVSLFEECLFEILPLLDPPANFLFILNHLNVLEKLKEKVESERKHIHVFQSAQTKRYELLQRKRKGKLAAYDYRSVLTDCVKLIK